jgi:hypothetical protein
MADALNSTVAFSEDDLQGAQQRPVVFGDAA